jgi:tetratricopeptide (TPR) repeat protein
MERERRGVEPGRPVWLAAAAIAAACVAAAPRTSAAGSPSASPAAAGDAAELTREGRRQWNRRTEDGLRGAVVLFEKALEADPGFAPALAGLADAYNMLGDYRHLAPREAYPRAREAARRALELDPSLAEAHASLGWASCIFDWDLDGARAAFERAIALDPRYAVAYHFFGFCLGTTGHGREARSVLETARRLDPSSRIIATDLAVLAGFERRWDEAAARLRELLDRDPGFVTARFSLGMAYEQMDRPDDALRELRQAVDRSGRSSLTLALLGHACATSGRTEEARRILAELRERARTRYVSSYDLAALLAALGDEAGALRCLEDAAAERAPWMLQLDGDPRFDRLRAEPTFQAFFDRSGLPRWSRSEPGPDRPPGPSGGETPEPREGRDADED